MLKTDGMKKLLFAIGVLASAVIGVLTALEAIGVHVPPALVHGLSSFVAALASLGILSGGTAPNQPPLPVVQAAPAAPPPSSGFTRLALMPALAGLCLLSMVSGCALLKAGNTASVTVDGQTVTATINPDGTVCSTKSPPIIFMGESCSQVCEMKAFPFVNLTCTSATTGALHTVSATLVTVSQAGE